MRPNHPAVSDIDLDETANKLLAPLGVRDVLEVEDIATVQALDEGTAREPALDETAEIELTADQMNALLAGEWQP